MEEQASAPGDEDWKEQLMRLTLVGICWMWLAPALLAQTASRDLVKKPIQNTIGMKLVEIPAGEFMMGTDEIAAELQKAFGLKAVLPVDDERPKHPVRITRPFLLGVHEVTVGE